MSKKTRFPELRAELRQREAHSKTIAKRIRESAGEERMRLWEQKREYGSVTRFILLMYALMRGLPRDHCEPAPTTERGRLIRTEQKWWLSSSIVWTAKQRGHVLERTAVEAWLNPKPPAPDTIQLDKLVGEYSDVQALLGRES